MKRSLPFFLTLLALITGFAVSAQKKLKDSSATLLNIAMNLEDAGRPADAIPLIKKAQKADPRNINCDYELAYANYLLKEYKQTVAILEPLLSRKDAMGKLYQLLGNTYDAMEQPEKAIASYQAGIEAFPSAGELYHEMGIMSLKKKQYLDALNSFEKGIEKDPVFPSNYYRAAKLFLSSNDKIWGMLYGELFIILEPLSERTREMSKLLYETYQKQIAIGPYGQARVYFANRALPDSIAMNDSLAKSTLFARKVYEPLLEQALKSETAVDLPCLMRVRTNFIDIYFRSDAWKKYPNALFDYQYKLLKAGKMDIYSRWVLLQHNRKEFQKWQNENQEAYRDFAKWLLGHPLNFDDKYKFYRQQYR